MSSNQDRQTVTTAQIDASCRWALLILFTGAAGWLALGALSGFFAIMKFHVPGMFAKCPVFSYGRLCALQNSLLIYGFCIPAGMGVSMWLMARLSRTLLAAPVVAIIAGIFWHTAVMLMTVGLAAGELTGYEWFEVPKMSAILIFGAYVFLSIPILLTLAGRREKELFPSQWFILASLFWFAWIFATACALIHCHPARGVAQAAIHYWYGNNLLWIVLGFHVLASVFYFLPKISGRELYSRDLAMFSFWSLLAIGSFGGVPSTAPLPNWMSSLSAMASTLALIPVFAVAMNCHMTTAGTKLKGNLPLDYVKLGWGLFVLAAFLTAIQAVRPFSEYMQLNMFSTGLMKLCLNGFVVLTLVGGMAYIVPKLTGNEWKLGRRHFGVLLLGLALSVGVLGVAGLINGLRSTDPEQYSYESILQLQQRAMQIATLGEMMLVVGYLILAVYLKVQCLKRCWACCSAFLPARAAKGGTAEVTA